ncbi:helix-turn-helix domain-containing protein [Sediminibacillus massiliensis]|uniref:helix-turn-helix domain-containing protein n=1 Tax=Sediminibacillus massiliensis TaxID=1926277 RepID=UPI0009883656|nr:helix-turn-helix transcriptional regulator [Sediminibacillus massiliensis]
MNDLYKLLKELRGKESLREASKRAGISHNYLSQLEKGIDPRTKKPIKPSPDTLKRLADAYNYSYNKLLSLAGYTEEAEQEKELETFIKDPELERWYRELPKSKEEDLRRLRIIHEAFKEEENKNNKKDD